MGWPGNWIDYAKKSAGDIVREAQQQFESSIRDLNNASDFQGSLKYLNPMTAGLALYGDYKNIEEKKGKEEAAAKEAEARYQESLKNIGSIADYQDLIAKDFDSKKDKYTGLLQDASNRDIRGQLTDTLTNAKNNFNARGLLKSGIRQFDDAKNNAKAITDIQNADYENAQKIANQARDFKNQALQTRTAAQGGQTAKNIADYQVDLANSQAQNQTFNALGQAGGQIAGSYLAKKKA